MAAGVAPRCLPTDGVEADAGTQYVDSATIVASPSRVYVNETMTFYVNATSTIPGVNLTVTIYYDYYLADGSTVNPASPVSVNVSETPANIVTKYTYDHIGNLTDADGTFFRVRVMVTEGTSTYPLSLKAFVVENMAPWWEGHPPATVYPIYDVPVPYDNLTFEVFDWDSEAVTVVWDFGDGTEPAVNETIGTPEGAYVRQSHTWAVELEPGRESYYINLNMSVSFTDAVGHVKYSNHTVNFSTPNNIEPDFTFAAKSQYWSPGFELPFYASATDPEGDPITWTYIFNDTYEDYLVEPYHTDPTEPGATVWHNITHTFPSVGTYHVTLFVSDALIPYQVGYHNMSITRQITVTENRAPGVLANITVTPTTPKINVTLGYAAVAFSIQANDADGDVMYVTWDFDDGTTASNESLGGIQVYTFKQVHRYNSPGLYNVTLTVDDARGHVVSRYKLVSVLTNNSGPVLKMAYFQLSNGTTALPGSTVNLTITLYDREADPLTVWVNFGDNSSSVKVELTEFTVNLTVSAKFSHVYDVIGTYNVTITYTDGLYGASHNVTDTLPVVVKVPRPIVIRIWNWWDYTSFGLFSLAIASVFVRWYMVGRFRKELDQVGLTLEEYKIIAKELKVKRNADLSQVKEEVLGLGLFQRLKRRRMTKEQRTALKRRRVEVRSEYKRELKALRDKGLPREEHKPLARELKAKWKTEKAHARTEIIGAEPSQRKKRRRATKAEKVAMKKRMLEIREKYRKDRLALREGTLTVVEEV